MVPPPQQHRQTTLQELQPRCRPRQVMRWYRLPRLTMHQVHLFRQLWNWQQQGMYQEQCQPIT